MTQSVNPSLLEFSWSAEVKLKNGLIISIWYTCWDSIKHSIDEVVSISSDIPKRKINNSILLGY
jgi:hypothetical protein